MTIDKAIEKFFFHCEIEKKLSEKTLKAYQIDLKQFSDFLTKNNICTLEEIDKEQLKSYLHQLSEFAPKTIKRKIATAKAFFNYHEFEESIIVNPFRKVKTTIKIPFQLPKVMTLEQVEKILSIVYLSKNEVTNKSSYSYSEKLRDVAILELLFATGIRVSELCNLTMENIDSDFSVIIVNGKGSKERTIPIPNKYVKESLMLYYNRFLPNIDKHLFVNRLNNKISEQSVRLMVHKYRKKANIQKHITPHVFRHSFATLLLEQDVDIRYIQNILGHSSINTTQIYTHVNNKKKCEILTLKHPRNGFIKMSDG